MKKYLVTASLFLSLTHLHADCAPNSKECRLDCRADCKEAPAVMLQSPCYTFETFLTALYMQPTASNLDYGAQANPFDFSVPVPAVSPNWVIHEISPSYSWGFDFGLAGICHGSNSILAANWERLHTSNSSDSASPPTTSMIGPFFEIGPDASFYKKAKGSVHFHFDEVNLNYGTFVRFGDRLRTNLFAGGSFVRLVQQRTTHFSNVSGTILRTLSVPARFIGGGPQLGTSFSYRIVRGFQVDGDARATLYVGRLHNKTTFTSTSPALVALGGPNPNVQTTTVHNRTGVVPGFEGKLGLAYGIEFGDDYLVKFEAGYRVQTYLSALRSIDMGSEVTLSAVATGVAGDTGVYARTFQRTISDFSLSGPYFTATFGF